MKISVAQVDDASSSKGRAHVKLVTLASVGETLGQTDLRDVAINGLVRQPA
jgi:hypothetical protein